MANICSAKFKRIITIDSIEPILNDINAEHFASLLVFEFDDKGYSISIPENSDLYGYVWIMKEGKELQWKQPYEPLLFWLISSVMSRLLHKLNPLVKINVEGAERKFACDFHIRYPKPMDSLLAVVNQTGAPKTTVHYLRDTYEQLYSSVLPKTWAVLK